jgi:hypothetical protein
VWTGSDVVPSTTIAAPKSPAQPARVSRLATVFLALNK